MDDPVKDIHEVVHNLCQSDPKTQALAIDKYFTRNASFTHPFCQTGSFDGSRTLIHFIFRWYKIMSPEIELTINSVAYDPDALLLYVNISQIFSIWFVPFHRAPVTLTTVLQLTHRNHNTAAYDPRKFYIQSQEDLYQTNQFVRFVLPWFGLGSFLVLFWHLLATVACALACLVGYPVTRWEQWRSDRGMGPLVTAAEVNGVVTMKARRGLKNNRTAPATTAAGVKVELNGGGSGKFGNMAVVSPLDR